MSINNPELPIMDGSSKAFIDAFLTSGLKETSTVITPIEITEPLHISDNNQSIIVTPSSESRFSYFLEYDHPLIQSQSFSITMNQKILLKKLVQLEHLDLNMKLMN